MSEELIQKHHLDESTFLVKLASLYEKNRDKGTVFLQMKRYAGRLASVRRKRLKRQIAAAEGQEPRCLVRAYSNQLNSKISAIIHAKDMVRFQLALGNIIRLHMDGLKRREKTPEERRLEREERKKAQAAKKRDAPAPDKGAKKDADKGKAEKSAASSEKAPESGPSKSEAAAGAASKKKRGR